ncbi:MAG: hypothetical protein EPN91_03740 [Salinibacterium sp.]|nr:MAG: hypothetical protein EPN91_03740 [Salinibacterium sp.]
MNWLKILANVAGVAIVCFGGHAIASGSVTSAATGTTAGGVLLCVLSNLVGLWQTPPTTTTTTTR